MRFFHPKPDGLFRMLTAFRLRGLGNLKNRLDHRQTDSRAVSSCVCQLLSDSNKKNIAKLEEYKHIIGNEFYPANNRNPKARFSVCRKALSDFIKLKPSEDYIAELMVFYTENACKFTYEYGDMREQYYRSIEGHFEKTMRHIVLHCLWDNYDSRIKQCLRWASPCGQSFPNAMRSIYTKFKTQNEDNRKRLRPSLIQEE